LEERCLLAAAYLPPSTLLAASDNYLSSPQPGDALEVALRFLEEQAATFRLDGEDFESFVVKDRYLDVDTGITHLYLRQHADGIEVRYADAGIHLSPRGEVIAASSSFLPELELGLAEEPRRPALNAIDAALQAAEWLGIGLASGPIYLSEIHEERSLAQVLDVPGLSVDDIAANLQWVPTAAGKVELAWQLIIRTPDGMNWWDLTIDAQSGSYLAKDDWVEDATYRVLARPTESPQHGPFQIVFDPQRASPLASPLGWHDTDGVVGAESTFTIGNNVAAHLDRDGDNAPDPGGRPDGGPGLQFQAVFDPNLSPLANAEAAVTNLFYWNNILHDIHYLYGFTPAAGNFQTNNYGQGGLGNDAVQADAQDNANAGSVNNANFATPPDGFAPRMQMFEWSLTFPRRDSDLDAGVIVHEYGHGVSNRLTGGPSNANALVALQSAGMGEGWSDWWSLMFLQQSATDTTQSRGIGTYVLGQAASGPGIRDYRYDFDITDPALETFLHFGAGSGQSTAVHDAGTRWASILWDLNHLLIQKYGYEADLYQAASPAGNIRALRLVMEALKLQPANPNFLQARDAILAADMALFGGVNHLEIWTAFARRGLGAGAFTSSASSADVVTSFELPTPFLSFRVLSVAPGPQAVVALPPTRFEVHWNDTYLPSSVDASDFTVNGLAADGFEWTDADTITFTYVASPVSNQGLQSIAVIADSIAKASDLSTNLGFTSTFRYDAMPLQAVGISPPFESMLLLGDPWVLDIDFNETVSPLSIGTDDLTLSAGTVLSAVALDADTVRYRLGAIDTETVFSVTLASQRLTDTFGNANPVSLSGRYYADASSVSFPEPWQSLPPAGSLVAAKSTTVILAPDDIDRLPIELDGLQTITLLVTPASSSLRSRIELLDSNQRSMGFAEAAAAGDKLWLSSIPIPAGGLYQVVVSSLDGTTGEAEFRLLSNALVEEESWGVGGRNDSLATAQSIEGFLNAIPGSEAARRGAVQGRLADFLPAVAPVATIDFESGNLPGDFTIASYTDTGAVDPNGRIRLKVPDAQGNPSNFALMMDRATPALEYTLNEAIWTVDLSAYRTLLLSFDHVRLNDEPDPLPTTFVEHAWGDGVAISDDGFTWRTILSAPSAAAWTRTTVNLTEAASSAGMRLGANFRIKFQQYDNFDLPTDGRGYDNIELREASEVDYYRLELTAGERWTVAVSPLETSVAVELQLLQASGNPVSQGVSGSLNIASLIRSWSVPASGTYYLQVSGELETNYLLLATVDADFDDEPNDTFAEAQPLTTMAGALGSLTANAYGRPLESFEGGPSDLASYTFLGNHSASVSAAAARKGSYGLQFGSGTSHWFYRDAPEVRVARGDIISYWVHTGSTPSSLRMYLGFGATASGTLSLVVGGNTNSLILQRNSGYGVDDLASVPHVWQPAQWYRCEVDWRDDGHIVGRLYGSDGTSLLRTVTANDTTITAGGLAFRSFSTPGFIDDIRLLRSSRLPADSDWYLLPAGEPGDQFSLETLTPLDGSGDPRNRLDPKLELYDPSQVRLAAGVAASDGRNENLVWLQALPLGGYRVRISAEGTSSGDYFLRTRRLQAIVLSQRWVAENSPAGSPIGQLSSELVGLTAPLAFTLVGGIGDAGNSSFQILGDTLQVNAPLDFELQSSYSLRVRVNDAAGFSQERVLTIEVTNVGEASVLQRQLFYRDAPNLRFNDGTGNPSGMIDPTRWALLPGQAATAAHYSNYLQGLNGLVVEVGGSSNLRAADFQFATWNGIDAAGFLPLAVTPRITVSPPAGNQLSQRATIEFPHQSIKNTWLRVNIQANESSDLANPDIFYFGSAIGDVQVGNIGNPLVVRTNASDTSAVRQNQSPAMDSVSISHLYDLNKDGRVNATDVSIVRQHQSQASLGFFVAPPSFRPDEDDDPGSEHR
jgi:extracellular elastinolytic metalloproteinase